VAAAVKQARQREEVDEVSSDDDDDDDDDPIHHPILSVHTHIHYDESIIVFIISAHGSSRPII